jgi:hypothetical protein
VEDDLIDPELFWRPEDFEAVDHLIKGRFDDRGQFAGSVSVYRGQPQEYVETWAGGKGRNGRCGPFKLTLGYVQGNSAESLLDSETFTLIPINLTASADYTCIGTRSVYFHMGTVISTTST